MIALKEKEAGYMALLVTVLTWVALLIFPDIADAAQSISRTDFTQTGAHEIYTVFLNTVTAHINMLLTAGSPAYQFVHLEVAVFGSYRLAIAVGRYAMAPSGDLTEIFQVTILVLLVMAMLNSYSALTSMLHGWSNDLAGVIQQQVGGNTEMFFASTAINKMLGSLSFTGSGAVNAVISFFGITSLVGIFIGIVIGLTIFALDIVVFIGISWSVWGFALAKFLGWFFIPFLLIERLAPMFDGWLRFLIGILFYAVIIRINAVLIVLLIQAYLGFGVNVTSTLIDVEPIVITVDSIADIGGLVGLCLVSILSIFATGRISTAMVGGMSGFGESVGAIARAIGGAKLLGK